MPRVKTSATPADGVLAVTLTLRIVEALAKSKVALGVTELFNIVDATKSRIHRHLVTLVQAGYVAQNAQTEKYGIGPRMVQLAQTIATGVEVVAAARPVLVRLRDDFSHTAVLARPEGDRVRILDVALGTSDFAIVQHTGKS